MGGAEENKRPRGKPAPRRGSGPIFVCDASAEAERLITSLRNRGYPTVDVPLGMLPSRVRYELPALVVCDADAHEALLRIKEMMEAASEPILLLFVGHDDGALRREAEFRELATATLTRPLNLTATVDLVQSIVGNPPDKLDQQGGKKARRPRAPVLVASARKPYRSDASAIEQAESSLPPEPPSIPAAPGAGSIAPSESVPPRISDTSPSGPPSSIPPSSGERKLSSETRSLLEEGRRRVANHPVQPSRPTRIGGDADQQGVPDERLLAALREPLGPEDLARMASAGEQEDGKDLAPDRSEPGSDVTGGPDSAEQTPLGRTGTITRDQVPVGPPEAAARSDDTSPKVGPASVKDVLGPEQADRPPSERTGDVSLRELDDQLPASSEPTPDSDAPFAASIGTSQRVGGPLPDRGSDAPSSGSDAVTLAPPRRTDSELPPEDQTNPGGRPPTNYPQSDQPIESLTGPSPVRLHGQISPPPLDDLSDLLTTSSRLAFEPAHAPRAPTHGSREHQGRPTNATRGPGRRSPVTAIGRVIRERWSGSLAQEDGGGVRRILLRDGDILTATSSREDESLTRYLLERGDLNESMARSLSALPQFGRHAGAALIARGILRQDDLWPVLRAHAEWLIGRMLTSPAEVVMEDATPARVSEEPAVFGGAAGAEIFMDVVPRVVDARSAFFLLGAGSYLLGEGTNPGLLGESALDPGLERRALSAAGADLNLIFEREPELLPVLLGLTELGVLSTGGERAEREPPHEDFRQRSLEIDDAALSSRVSARRALVDKGDYFTILGVSRSATGPEVDRARASLHRELALERLTPKTAYLKEEIELILQVVDEAHLILRDDVRRQRYRLALEEPPQAR